MNLNTVVFTLRCDSKNRRMKLSLACTSKEEYGEGKEGLIIRSILHHLMCCVLSDHVIDDVTADRNRRKYSGM